MGLICAWDPGLLTGLAAWDTEAEEISLITQLTMEEVWAWVDENCSEMEFSQVEQFTINAATSKKARQSEPIHIIGFLMYASWRCGFPIKYSKPADVMRAFPDSALRKAGVYVTGVPHGIDALRHLCYYLVREGQLEARRFLN